MNRKFITIKLWEFTSGPRIGYIRVELFYLRVFIKFLIMLGISFSFDWDKLPSDKYREELQIYILKLRKNG